MSEFTPGTPMRSIIDCLLTRRSILKGSATLAAASFIGLGAARRAEAAISADALTLNFDVVPTSDFDAVVIPPGHSAQVLYAYGDPILSGLLPFSNAGTEPGVEFDNRAGDHHDGMHFFGMDTNGAYDPAANNRGILCINHENITRELMHPSSPTMDADGNRTVVDEVRKEQRAHGVSCIEVVRDEATGQFSVVQDSPFNRRITAQTPTVMNGPAAGSPLLQTVFSPDGTAGRGTLNNCANGFTPWGTYITCEENYDLYFRDERGLAVDVTLRNPALLGFANYLAGIGVRVPEGLYGWATLAGNPEEIDNEFRRFNVTPSGADATQDFRNEGNQYGYVVEIDPFDPTAAPRKRTALGRFAHEGAWLANVTPGEPIVVYMGDDDELQYIYKFVSTEVFTGIAEGESPLAAGDRYLHAGTLYVARFDANALAGTQTGVWLPLTVDNPDLQAASAPGAPFAGLFDTLDAIIVHARAAAFAVGATPMDRPEWGAVNPGTGEVYFTLTNNSDRQSFDDADEAARIPGDETTRDEVTELLANRLFGVVPANPRGPNPDGHIIRLNENGDDPTAVGFAWEIFVYGSALDAETNYSGLTADNEFTDCDGLWFDPACLLWIQTDGGQPNGNNQMLAAIPGVLGDGGIHASNTDTNLRRFLVGPVGCEITGITMTPDRRSLFVNIQHPGESSGLTTDPATFVSSWPNDSRNATEAPIAGVRARSATIVITRDDGGTIGTA